MATIADPRRVDALRIAAEHGPMEASRQTGVPASTIRSWRSRLGQAAPPAGVDPAVWLTRKQTGADGAWRAAEAALAQVHELLEAGKTADAQRAALTMAIALDKSLLLEAAAAAAEERRVLIDLDHARKLEAVVLSFLEAVGVPASGSVRKILASLLRQAGAGEPLAAPAAETMAARAEIAHLAVGTAA